MKFPRFTDKDWFGGAVIVCIGVTLFVLLSNISSVIAVLAGIIGYFRPVILGVVIAYIISPLAKLFFYRVFRRISHRKLRWYLSVFLSFALLMLAFFLLAGMLLPQLIRSIVTFSQSFDSYTKSFKQLIAGSPLKTIIDEENMELLNQNVMSAISGYVKEAANNALSIAASAGKNILSTVIALILAVYLLLDFRNVLSGARKLIFKILPGNASLVFMDFVLRCDTILVSYITQTLLDALIIGSVNAIFMAICKMPYIGLISVVVGVTNLVPNFGPAIGAVIGAFILLLAGPGNTVLFLVFCLLLQSVDAYILKPRLFSSALGVSGLSILISTIVLGNMFGIPGVLLSIPVAAILSFAYHEYFMKSQKGPQSDSGREK